MSFIESFIWKPSSTDREPMEPILATKLPDAIDEAAAQAIKLGRTGAETLARLPGGLKALGSRAIERLTPVEDREKLLREQFQPRAKGLAFVGNLSPDNSEDENRTLAAKAAAALRFGYILHGARVAAVFTLARESDEAEPVERLKTTAFWLPRYLKKETSAQLLLVNPNQPVRIPKEASTANPRPAYEAINEAMGDFGEYLEHTGGKAIPAAYITALFVTEPGPAEIFGLDREHINNGAVAAFHHTGRTTRDYEWAPLEMHVPFYRPEQPAEQRLEEVAPTIDIDLPSAQQDDVAPRADHSERSRQPELAGVS